MQHFHGNVIYGDHDDASQGVSCRNTCRRSICDLPSGAKLDTPFSECKLATLLGVSWAYLSDTVRILAYERFLEIVPTRKIVVRPLSIEGIQKIYEVQFPLEGMTAWPAANRGPTLGFTSYKPKLYDVINNSKVYDPLEKYAEFNSEVFRSTLN